MTVTFVPALGVVLLMGLQEGGSPRTAEEQVATFRLADGFEIELVAGDPDCPKIVDIAFDDAGRMWAITASEYPIDGNENPAAEELYRKGGKDQVLVFDAPLGSGRRKPRVFVDGLAMPMAVLPLGKGALVGHGPEILRFTDEDGDGKAERREVVLSGFGIQDSHLMPHRFTRGPGGWVYVAQGAFNASNVRAKDGTVTKWDQCKVGRFKPDGSVFETVGWGLNNIWGFVVDRRGEMWIQEANDLGYPLVPFYLGGSYPGIGSHKSRPYSPWQPPIATFRMGGTGLSGLALDEGDSGFPAAWKGAMFLANPITRQIQAIRIHREGTGYRLEKLPELVTSTDPWFRPVAIHAGPEGALYVVDWYNKIISHNEVPRSHPERDKTRSRVWRIRPSGDRKPAMADLTKATEPELLATLAGSGAFPSRAAMRQIVDRKCGMLAPELKARALDATAPLETRLLALWALEGLGAKGGLESLAGDPDRAIRREAVRALGAREMLVDDPDPQVRQAMIRSATSVPMLLRLARGPLDGPRVKVDQGGDRVLTGEAADREFERSLVRARLEEWKGRMVDADLAAASVEARLLAALAIGDAARLAKDLGVVDRAPSIDELELLVSAGQGDALLAAAKRGVKLSTLALLKGRLQDAAALGPFVQAGLAEEPDAAIALAASFRLSSLEPDLARIAEARETPHGRRVAAVRALAELESGRAELFQKLASTGKDDLRKEAALALAGSREPSAASRLGGLWSFLPAAVRKAALDRLSGSKAGAKSLLEAVDEGRLPKESIDLSALEKLAAVLGDAPEVARLKSELASLMRPVLRLPGGSGDYLAAGIELAGPFTVETWVRLDPGITNGDSILCQPGEVDFNFHDAKPRLWVNGKGDVIVAPKVVEAEAWVHIALARDVDGRLRLYVNGTRVAESTSTWTGSIRNGDIGRGNAGALAGRLSDYRVWSTSRSAEEIGESFNVGVERAPGLVTSFAGSAWAGSKGKAKSESTLDLPPRLTEAEAGALKARFDGFRRRLAAEGDASKGKAVFAKTCQTCHKVKGEGADIGPSLDGAGLVGVEGLLRATLTPSAAMESGYRLFRVETADGDVLDGLLTSQDESSLVLRRAGREDLRVPRSQVKRAAYSRLSVMPEGLLDALSDADLADLFSYLRSVK